MLSFLVLFLLKLFSRFLLLLSVLFVQLQGNLETWRREVLSLWHLQKFSLYLLSAIYIFSIWLHRSYNKYLSELIVWYFDFLWSVLLFMTCLIHSRVYWLPWSCCQMCIRIFAISVSVSITTAHSAFRCNWLLVLTMTIMATW